MATEVVMGAPQCLKWINYVLLLYIFSATGSSGSEDVEGSSNGLGTGRGLSVGRSGPSRPLMPGVRPKRTDRPEDDDSVFLPSKGKIPATALETKSRDD